MAQSRSTIWAAVRYGISGCGAGCKSEIKFSFIGLCAKMCNLQIIPRRSAGVGGPQLPISGGVLRESVPVSPLATCGSLCCSADGL